MSKTTVPQPTDIREDDCDVTPISLAEAPSPNEIDFCTRFDEYTVVETVRRTESVYTSHGGRFAGHIVELPARKEFRIVTYNGARASDLAELREDLTVIRAGRYARYPWTEGVYRSGPHAGELYRCVVPEVIRPVSGGWIVGCEEPGCSSFGGVHETVDTTEIWFWHYALNLKAPDGSWHVSVDRSCSELTWTVDVVGDGCLTGDAAAAMAVALSTAADEARRLDAAREQVAA